MSTKPSQFDPFAIGAPAATKTAEAYRAWVYLEIVACDTSMEIRSYIVPLVMLAILIMMIAAALGGFLGARYSRGLNPRFMRMLVVGIGLGMAAYFFWKQYA